MPSLRFELRPDSLRASRSARLSYEGARDGTDETRTRIVWIDNPVLDLSATVPKLRDGACRIRTGDFLIETQAASSSSCPTRQQVDRRESNPHKTAFTARRSARLSYDPQKEILKP